MANITDITIEVSRDKMSAYLTIADPSYDRPVTREAIRNALANSKVVFGVIDSEIDRIVDRQIFAEDVLIAKGAPAEHGKDGYVEYMFSFTETVAPKVLEDGRVDYYDMNVIHPIMKDAPLCRLHEPTPGKNGSTVLGAVLTAKPGRPSQLPRGRNTRISDAGDELLADIDGQIKQSGKNVDVIQEFEVPENVDFSIGNIHFPGSVTVRGNVQSGFVVQSGGDVTVYGRVENAGITALGNIVLHGGMTGQGSGVLRAGGDIFAKFIENSRITASGKITAECIMHSTARAGAGIELIGKKGLIVGGSAKAREYIKAVTIGSPFATNTEIEVGNDPKLNDRLKDIKAELAALEAEVKKAAQALCLFENLLNTGAKLTPQKALIHEKTKKTHAECNARFAALSAEQQNIEAMLGANVRGVIRASNIIYSGVKVSIASNSMLLNEDLQHCSLVNDSDGIRVAAY